MRVIDCTLGYRGVEAQAVTKKHREGRELRLTILEHSTIRVDSGTREVDFGNDNIFARRSPTRCLVTSRHADSDLKFRNRNVFSSEHFAIAHSSLSRIHRVREVLRTFETPLKKSRIGTSKIVVGLEEMNETDDTRASLCHT